MTGFTGLYLLSPQNGHEVSAVTCKTPCTIVIPVLFLCLLSLSGKKALLSVLVPLLQSFLFQHLDGFLGLQLWTLLSPNLSMGKGEKSVQSSAGLVWEQTSALGCKYL